VEGGDDGEQNGERIGGRNCERGGERGDGQEGEPVGELSKSLGRRKANQGPMSVHCGHRIGVSDRYAGAPVAGIAPSPWKCV
jgi:hypothetical protein